MRSIHQPKKPFLERCKEEPAVPIGIIIFFLQKEFENAYVHFLFIVVK